MLWDLSGMQTQIISVTHVTQRSKHSRMSCFWCQHSTPSLPLLLSTNYSSATSAIAVKWLHATCNVLIKGIFRKTDSISFFKFHCWF